MVPAVATFADCPVFEPAGAITDGAVAVCRVLALLDGHAILKVCPGPSSSSSVGHLARGCREGSGCFRWALAVS